MRFLSELVYLSHLSHFQRLCTVFSKDFESKINSKEKYALTHSFRFLLIFLTKTTESW